MLLSVNCFRAANNGQQVAGHDDQSSKKRQRKKKSLQRYRALSDNCMENKVFVSKNDRSK